MNADIFKIGIMKVNIFKVDNTYEYRHFTVGKMNADILLVGNMNADILTDGNMNADILMIGAINADILTVGNMNARHFDGRQYEC
jgi:hypothetical protein